MLKMGGLPKHASICPAKPVTSQKIHHRKHELPTRPSATLGPVSKELWKKQWISSSWLSSNQL
jgi:hypothetical protein